MFEVLLAEMKRSRGSCPYVQDCYRQQSDFPRHVCRIWARSLTLISISSKWGHWFGCLCFSLRALLLSFLAPAGSRVRLDNWLVLVNVRMSLGLMGDEVG